MTTAKTASSASSHRGRSNLSRRALLGAGLGAAALWTLRPLGALTAPTSPPLGVAARSTWLLASPSELRPDPPGAPTEVEIEELLDLQRRRTEAIGEVAARWGTGPAVLPWTRLALDLIETQRPGPVRAARALALLHAATDDAAAAAADAQAAYHRPLPTATVPGLAPFAAPAAGRWSYPSEHATVAVAAATILGELFPAAAESLDALAWEAALSRLSAGAAYRSDVEAGRALGRAIGERAVAHGRSDGADAVWDGHRPTAAGTWRPTPPKYVASPLDPLAGTWTPWVIAAGSLARPAPPPAWGSPAWRAELAAVQAAVARRTPAQADAVRFWAGDAGTVTPAGLWVEIARYLIARDALDTSHAARVLALTSVAMADAFVCCWDAKYAYWMARPITADPELDVLIPTPPFPSYPSGHATISAAAAAILGHLFPGDAEALAAKASEAKDSRLWAGIHFPIDNDAGAAMGGLVGRLLADVARNDGT